MAGAAIEVDDRQVLEALSHLGQQIGDLEPVFRDMGEYLIRSTRERFGQAESPQGTPWAPLSPRYQRRKKRNIHRILVLYGDLKDSIHYSAGPRELQVGTNLIYGASHQFGRPEAGIPARPFLGLSGRDRAEVLQILRDHLAGA